MKPKQLEQIREEIRFDKRSFADCLGIPYRTLQNYCYGVNSIPKDIARKALELKQINITFLSGIPARVDANLPPGGCPNELRRH